MSESVQAHPGSSARSATAAKAADDGTQCRHQSFLSLERLSGHQPACPENGTRAGPRNSELDSTGGACSVLTAFGRGVGQVLAPSNGRSVDLRLVTSLTELRRTHERAQRLRLGEG